MNKNMRKMFTEEEIKNVVNYAIEKGLVENAKPVYCHPVYATFIRDDNALFTFTCLIFNNDKTAFTPETFVQWCKTLFSSSPNASIMASGYFNNFPISKIYDHANDRTLNIQRPISSGGVYVNDNNSFTVEQLNSGTFIDGVNKIN